MCLFLCGHSSPVLPFPLPAVIPAKAGIQETGPGRLIGVEFSQMARSVIVPLTDIPASTVIYGQEVLYAAGGHAYRT